MLFEIIGEEAIILEWKGRDPFTAFSRVAGALLTWKSRDPFWQRKVDRRVQQIASRLERKLPEFSQIEAEPNREIKLAKLKKLLAEIRSQVFDYAKELPPLR
jgi:hypothetical protein